MKVLSTIKRPSIISLLLIVLVFLGLGLSSARAAILATANTGTDTVYFRSSAKLEFIEGTSSAVAGWIDFDPDDPQGQVNGIFRVDLRMLKTSIAKRDEHMRDNHLHTDKYPYAFFEVNQLTGLAEIAEAGENQTVSASGFFYLHGVKRKLTAQLDIVNQTGSGEEMSYQLIASFSVLLEDYQIPRPKLLLLKLAKEIELKIVMSVSSELAPIEIELPDYVLAE